MIYEVCILWKLQLNIKKGFEKLSSKEVIQLYLIVIMTYALIYIFYNELSSLIYPKKNNDSSIVKLQKDNKKKLTDLELITYLNNNSKQYSIVISETRILDNSIEIKIIGVYKDIVSFLNKISYNLKIKQFEMKRWDKDITVSIRLDGQNFYLSQSTDLKMGQLVNPFIIKRDKKEYKVSDISISAIIDTEILIDNSWYKKGDSIKTYEILSIQKNEVILFDSKTKKKIIKSINYE